VHFYTIRSVQVLFNLVFDTPAVLSHYCVCILLYSCSAYMIKYVGGGVGTRTHIMRIYIQSLSWYWAMFSLDRERYNLQNQCICIYIRTVHRDGLYAEGGCATHRTLLRGCLYIMYTSIHILHIHSYVYIFQYPIFI